MPVSVEVVLKDTANARFAIKHKVLGARSIYKCLGNPVSGTGRVSGTFTATC